MGKNTEDILMASEILRKASSLLVLTGAGVSAESDIPTFRGDNGLWNKHNPEDLVSVDGFRRNPALVWEWHCSMRKLAMSSNPNAGHFAIAQLEREFFCDGNFLLITQNIDDLHRRAGSENIAEIHGNIFFERCTKCAFRRRSEVIYDDVPRCPQCGSILRPDVVFFGEPLPEMEIAKSFSFAQKTDCILVVGTSGVVYPAAQIPYIVIEHGGKVIEVNKEETPLTKYADVHISGESGTILPEIVKTIR